MMKFAIPNVGCMLSQGWEVWIVGQVFGSTVGAGECEVKVC